MPTGMVKGFRIHYEAAGPEDALPIVFIHGVTLSLKSWREIPARLAKEFRVIALDLLGHGDSEKPAGASHSIELQSQIVLALMDSLSIQQAVLVGHSMGGEIALWIASHHPDRVKKLVTLAAVTLGTLSPRANSNFALMRYTCYLPPAFGYPLGRILGDQRNPLRKMMADSMYFARPQPDTLFHEVYDEQTRPDNYASKRASINAIYRYRALDDAQNIVAPLLIVAGDQDRTVPLEQALALQECLPAAQLIKLPECGHVAQYDAPDEFVNALQQFLTNGA